MIEVVKNAKDNSEVVFATERKVTHLLGRWSAGTDDRKLTNATPMRFLPSPRRRTCFILGRQGHMWRKKYPELEAGEWRAGKWPAVFSGFPSQAHLDPTAGDRRNVQMVLQNHCS